MKVFFLVCLTAFVFAFNVSAQAAEPTKPAPAKPVVQPAVQPAVVTVATDCAAVGSHPRLTMAAGVAHKIVWRVFHPLGGRFRCR